MHPTERLRTEIGRPSIVHAVPNANGGWSYPVQSEADYRAFALDLLRKQGKPQLLVERPETPLAFVSDGRWVVDCLCGNGPSASPEWGVAICCECGALYRPTFPADAATAETTLLARPWPQQRHYQPDRQTLADLQHENARLLPGGLA